ncbi:MAG: alpha-ribazole phosphatase [Armatimonadota bacterium]
MGLIYLIRHGEVAWNKEGAYVGATDLPLNETGRKQARLLAEHIKHHQISAIYSSDLQRASETAEIIAEKYTLHVQATPLLREVNYGEWEGLTEAAISSRYPDIFAQWRVNAADTRIPGGETFREMLERSLSVFTRITEDYPDENVLIVAHKSVNRVILCHLLGMDINGYKRIGQENSCVNIVQRRKNGDMVIQTINDRCHLRDIDL